MIYGAPTNDKEPQNAHNYSDPHAPRNESSGSILGRVCFFGG